METQNKTSKTKEYKYAIGDVIYRFRKKEHYIKMLNQKIMHRTVSGVVRNEKGYDYECLTCGFKGDKTEDRFNRGEGCPICSSNKVMVGYNDIATTNPDMVKWFLHEEDTKKYSSGSHKKVDFKCIHCGHIKKIDISSFFSQGFSCPICSDGFSYPTKVISNILSDINIQFIQEAGKNTFEWLNENVRYDFYIPSINCIIEAHGRQHYDGGFASVGGKTKEQERLNDLYKKELALNNGISNYVELNCSSSRIDLIRKQFIESGILDKLKISDSYINWKLIHEKSSKGNLIIACELWNKYKDMRKIEKEMNISRSALMRYLKSGSEIGICDYNTQEQRLVRSKLNSKEVFMYKDDEFIDKFQSANHIQRISKERFGVYLCSKGIHKNCKNIIEEYKGFVFKYAKGVDI